MTRQEKITEYRLTTKVMLNKRVKVKYKRTKDNIHELNGIVVKLRKSSLKLLIND